MLARSLVIIPTYDEAENILPLTREVLSQDSSLDVLVVDDGSPDGTGDRVERERGSQPRLFLHRRNGKLGLGSAYQAGFRLCLEREYGRALTMDGDGSHDPRYLPAILEAARDADMAIGSRYVPGGGIANWPLHRRALSAFANWYTRTLLRVPQRDSTSGYRCYSREVLETVDPFAVKASGYSFLEEMVCRVHRAGFRIVEVPIVFIDRRSGRSKISRVEIFRAAWHVVRTALWAPPVQRARSPRLEESPPDRRSNLQA